MSPRDISSSCDRRHSSLVAALFGRRGTVTLPETDLAGVAVVLSGAGTGQRFRDALKGAQGGNPTPVTPTESEDASAVQDVWPVGADRSLIGCDSQWPLFIPPGPGPADHRTDSRRDRSARTGSPA